MSLINKYFLLTTSFLVGFSLMTIELTSTRIIAPYLGSSLYTWTSAIGVILFGLSIGNWWGGFVFDKYRTRKTLFIFFTLAAFWTATIPFLSRILPYLAFMNWPLLFIVLAAVLILFLLPSVFVGTLYPGLVKSYLKNIETTGARYGELSALWALGSIAGTFLTGFYFIGFLGSAATIFGVSILLFLNGLLVSGFGYKKIAIFAILLAAIIFVPHTRGEKFDLFSKESPYYLIRVKDSVSEIYGKARMLFLDFDMHSIEKSDGGHLEIYTEIYPVFSVMNPEIKNILAIGGGSYSMPKSFYDFYKGSSVTVAEIDPAVTEVADNFFNLKSYPIKTVAADGRLFLFKNSEKYDLIFSDTYNSFISVPWHLATKEFNDLVKSRLNENGIYAVNFISSSGGKDSLFFESMLATFSKTFGNYYIFTFGPKLGEQNIVLVGVNSVNHIDPALLEEKIGYLENGEFLSSRLMIEVAFYPEKTVILTDDFAPTDRLMQGSINRYFSHYAEWYYLESSRKENL